MEQDYEMSNPRISLPVPKPHSPGWKNNVLKGVQEKGSHRRVWNFASYHIDSACPSFPFGRLCDRIKCTDMEDI